MMLEITFRLLIDLSICIFLSEGGMEMFEWMRGELKDSRR